MAMHDLPLKVERALEEHFRSMYTLDEEGNMWLEISPYQEELCRLYFRAGWSAGMDAAINVMEKLLEERQADDNNETDI